MGIKTGISAIASEVIGDIQKEAEIALLDAQNQAKETLRIANEKAKETYNTIIADAKKQAEAEKRKSASIAEMEMRNRLLQTKEALVDETFDHVVEKLENFTKTKEYHNYLLGLIEAVAEKLAQSSLLVYVTAKDKSWLTKDLLSSISKKLHTELHLAQETLDIIGGCRIQTEGNKIIYDATIDSRLQELKPILRSQIAIQLFGAV
ncbi:MAG: V-type ATP synthase subunit E [Nitrososphaerota archaeon]|jgi:vacuolar-type H+-ATPase subunit E/Vma4|nr:V-type ATP synthase subunit E [Nitrososphaerota archaeon]